MFMKKEYTIKVMASLRFSELWFVLNPDDNRWIELVSLKGWDSEFHQWLVENSFECLPQYAKKFMAKKDKEIYGKKDWEGIVKAHIGHNNNMHYIGFYNILEKRLKEYKDKPYQGKPVIGHFLGIKKNADDDPYQYEDHIIGQVEDYREEPDGHISTYVLSKPDNTEVTLPVEMTYRIY